MSLKAVQSCDKFTTVEKAKAQCCLDNFKNEINEEYVYRFWCTTNREKQELKLTTLKNGTKVSQEKKNLLVGRVVLQHAELLYATAQEAGKQSQIVQQKITNELNESVVTPSDRSPPPSYNSADDSLNDYNTSTSDEIDPDVAKNVKTETRKRTLMEDTGNKISTKGAKRNKSSNQDVLLTLANQLAMSPKILISPPTILMKRVRMMMWSLLILLPFRINPKR